MRTKYSFRYRCVTYAVEAKPSASTTNRAITALLIRYLAHPIDNVGIAPFWHCCRNVRTATPNHGAATDTERNWQPGNCSSRRAMTCAKRSSTLTTPAAHRLPTPPRTRRDQRRD